MPKAKAKKPNKTPQRAKKKEAKPPPKKPRANAKPAAARNKRTRATRFARDGRRWYTDDERSTIMAALKANGGDVRLTATQLEIPYHTLYAWSVGWRCPEALQLHTEREGDLAGALEEIAWAIVAEIPQRIPKAPLNHLSGALDKAIDKSQLLQGKPTQNAFNRNLSATVQVEQMAANYAKLNPDERAALGTILAKLGLAPTGTAPLPADGPRELRAVPVDVLPAVFT